MELLTVVHVIVCVVIILFVMLQNGGGAAGGVFGGGNANSAFGAAGPASFLVKVTAAGGALFFITSIALTAIGTRETGSLVDRIDLEDATASQEAAVSPATYAGVVSDASTGESIEAYVAIAPGSKKVQAVGGKYSLSVANAGQHTLSVTAPGYLPMRERIDLKPGATVDRGIRLSKAVARIEATDDGISVDPISFANGTSEIEDSSEGALSVVAQYLFGNPTVKLAIEGHTDNQGDSDQNLALSEGRAEAVRQYLIGLGVNDNRITSAGFGDTKPKASNETDEGRSLNRRVEFKISD